MRWIRIEDSLTRSSRKGDAGRRAGEPQQQICLADGPARDGYCCEDDANVGADGVAYDAQGERLVGVRGQDGAHRDRSSRLLPVLQ